MGLYLYQFFFYLGTGGDYLYCMGIYGRAGDSKVFYPSFHIRICFKVQDFRMANTKWWALLRHPIFCSFPCNIWMLCKNEENMTTLDGRGWKEPIIRCIRGSNINKWNCNIHIDWYVILHIIYYGYTAVMCSPHTYTQSAHIT